MGSGRAPAPPPPQPPKADAATHTDKSKIVFETFMRLSNIDPVRSFFNDVDAAERGNPHRRVYSDGGVSLPKRPELYR
jgi:hypothetical protein